VTVRPAVQETNERFRLFPEVVVAVEISERDAGKGLRSSSI
jgi:hypothetical protein